MTHSTTLRRTRFAAHRIAAAAALAATGWGAASAQQPAPEMGKLAPVNVTAERRTENVQDVPNSVSTLGSEILEVIGTSGQDVRVLSGRVPSLNIESSFGRAFPRFYIRGYGNTDFRLNASQPVSLVYDDVVQENPILKGFPVFDLDRIEVLRGPQGTLFGRNTPAGVVKFESVRPGKALEGYGSLSFGTFKTINAEGAVNVPTSDDSALRISLLNQTRDDWVHNTNPAGLTQDFEGYRDSAVRAQWLVQPNKDFSALINLHARDYDGSARLVSRQHHPAGDERFRCRVRRAQDFNRRQERADVEEPRRQPAAAVRARQRDAAFHHRLRIGRRVQSRRHRRRFAALCLQWRRGLDPVLFRNRRRDAQAPAADAGIPRRVGAFRPAELAGGRVPVPGRLQGREFRLRLGQWRGPGCL